MAKRKRGSNRRGKRRIIKRSKRGRRSISTKNRKFSKALSVLKSMNKSDRCKAIASSNNAFIHKFCTAVRKLRTRKPTPQMIKRLSPYKLQLRKLSNPKLAITSKRKILTQRGGGLFALLAPLLAPIIGSLIGGR